MSGSANDFLTSSHAFTLVMAGNFPIDENIIAAFPQGTKIISGNRHGTSNWTITARVIVELPDGMTAQYFVKCATEDTGREMLEGEFHAMLELYKKMPSMVPKPNAFGNCKSVSPESWYLLSQFIDMGDELPNPDQLSSKLAQLHRTSISPTGKFGFHRTTFQGRTPQSVGWEDTWTTLFTKMLQHVIDLDFKANGYWEELDKIEKRVLSHVVPRLIGILETDGRWVKPSLCHGDLWEGNTGTACETGDIYIFDSGALYAHNEFEIGDWRCNYNKIHDKVYTSTYLRYYDPSEPTEEWDDRNRMYCIYFNIIYSVNHVSQGQAVRQQAYDDMFYLIDKYAPFEEGEEPPRIEDTSRATLSAERDHTRG